MRLRMASRDLALFSLPLKSPVRVCHVSYGVNLCFCPGMRFQKKENYRSLAYRLDIFGGVNVFRLFAFTFFLFF